MNLCNTETSPVSASCGSACSAGSAWAVPPWASVLSQLWVLSFVKVQFRIGVNWLHRSSQGNLSIGVVGLLERSLTPRDTHTYLVEEQDEIDGEGDK